MFSIKAKLAALFVTSPFVLADVHLVDPADGAGAIQTAVALANAGDVLLVRSGSYAGFTVMGKGLTILSDGASAPQISGTINLLQIPATDEFVLRGFDVDATDAPGQESAFVARGCEGVLLIEDCTFQADHGVSGMDYALFPGKSGIRVVNSVASIWNRCTATGGSGANLFDEDFDYGVGSGGHGFELGKGSHALYDCVGVGGNGGTIYDTEPYDGGRGGSAVHFAEFGVVSGCELIGGFGGSADCSAFLGCGSAGSGGNALEFGVFGQPSEAWTLDNIFSPGTAGQYPTPGFDGMDVRLNSLDGLHLPLAGEAKHLEVSSLVRVGDPGALTVHGEPGELALLFFSIGVDFAPNLALNGIYALDPPLRFISPGVLPGTGMKTLPFTIQPIGGIDAVSVYLQALMFDGSESHLSGLSTLTIVDQ